MKNKGLIFLALLVAVSLSTGNRAQAQDSTSHPSNPMPRGLMNHDSVPASADEDMQLLRKDLRSQKKQIVAANMDLTDAEAEKFWPVYDRYTADLTKVNDRKAALIKEYAENYSVMTGEQAESYIQRRTAVEESVAQLKLQYIPQFRKVLSGRQTALFFQIDWRLGLMIDLQLAQMPLLEP